MHKHILAAAAATAALFAFAPSSAEAGCKEFKYGYVGYTRSGTESFSKKRSLKLATDWQAGNGGRIGATTLTCKPFGFASEWECHATTRVCK
ncbi:MAG: hypothetical protein AB7U38_02950 [Hyphomicrobiales bacterium]